MMSVMMDPVQDLQLHQRVRTRDTKGPLWLQRRAIPQRPLGVAPSRCPHRVPEYYNKENVCHTVNGRYSVTIARSVKKWTKCIQTGDETPTADARSCTADGFNRIHGHV